MVRELPRVTINGKAYYVDLRLCQLRNVDNPHEYQVYGDEFQLIDSLLESGVNILEIKRLQKK